MSQQPLSFIPSRAHRVWRALPPHLRRRALTQATAWLAPLPDPIPPSCRHGVVIAGELSRASGLGEGARVMAAAIRDLGLPVWTIDVAPPVDKQPEVATDLHEAVEVPPGAPLIAMVNSPLLPLFLMRMPRRLVRGRRIIGYWAWELPNVPTEWQAGVRFVHDVWAPSHFTAEALGNICPAPVRVVPTPLAAMPPTPSVMGRAAFELPDHAVVVLVSFNLASSFVRKNPLASIEAFRSAFGERADRILVLKIGHADHAPEDFARIVQAATAPNIRVITRMMAPDERHALTAASDIVLSLHRSEGLGLVPAEAMLLGKPVIATGWSGNMTFMDESSAALVGYRLIPAEDPRHVYHGAKWADPDIGSAIRALRQLADNPDARRRLGERARQTAQRQLSAVPLAAALASLGLLESEDRTEA